MPKFAYRPLWTLWIKRTRITTMTRIKTILAVVITLIAAVSCMKEIENRLDSIESRVSVLEQISESSKNGYIITSVTSITENSEIIGYRIEFKKGNPINVYFGKNGKDGVDGKDGDSMFQSVTVTDTEVTFVTADGRSFVICRATALSINFDSSDLVVMGTNSTRNIHYSITSDIDGITIEAMSSADIKVKVEKTDARTGVLQVKTGATIDEYSKVLVLVSNGCQAIMRTLIFEKEAIEVEENTTKEVADKGGEVTLEFFSNVPCHAVIPEEARNWISVLPETRAMTKQSIRLIAEPNTGAARSATVIVRSEDDSMDLSYLIVQKASSDIFVPEYVDLGLSVKWATCNLGASIPEGFGDYYAWGETEPHYEPGYAQSNNPVWKTGKERGYDWSTYKFELGEDWQGPFSKYVTSSSYGIPDHKFILDLEDDAAHVKWGGYWRIPTQNEWYELIENCQWIWTAENGVYGYRITSNKSGYTDKSIFLPAAGWRRDDHYYPVGNESGHYWSSILVPDRVNYLNEASYGVSISKNTVDDVHESFRYYGFSVRPVYGEFIPVSSISFSEESLLMYETSSEYLGVTITPENATVPFSYRPSFRLLSSDETIVQAPGTPDSKPGTLVEGKNSGVATITAYASNGMSASTIVTIEKTPDIHPQAIDLGLSVKWASFNVGAVRPEGFGYHLAWGETEPKKDFNYSWETYKWGNKNTGTLTKYNTVWELGAVDNKTVLDPEDDAAHVNWGGSWRMPTTEEILELVDDCLWISTTERGVNGYRIVSKKPGFTENSIFLPNAGDSNEHVHSPIGVNTVGLYWSSSIECLDNPFVAFTHIQYQNSVGFNNISRFNGFSVRPVMDK